MGRSPRKQIEEISAGGWPVAARKAYTVARLTLAVAARIVRGVLQMWKRVPGWLLRAAAPLVRIRIGELSSSRIGHLAFEPDLYLCEKVSGLLPPRTLDLFYHGSPPCNHQLAKMWGRRLRINRFAGWLDGASRMVAGHDQHVVPQYVGVHTDPRLLMSRLPAQLDFTEDEQRYGRAELEALGIPCNAQIVCFHLRDSAYLEKEYPSQVWAYHDFRDARVADYSLMARSLADLGYFVVRFGSVAKERLEFVHPRVIDYPFSGRRSDFLDLYLVASSQFMVATNSGPCGIAWIFRRPVAFANVSPFFGLTAARVGDLFVPRMHWFEAEGRRMTFREILASGAGDFYRSEQFTGAGIRLQENTPEEIRDIALEMEARLRGAWKSTAEDEALQQRFQDGYRNSANPRHAVFTAAREAAAPGFVLRLGTRFLRQYAHLLD